MSKKKPLSAEEKQTKLLELFHETNDVYQLKDLERLAPQQKGIVQQSVKATLQSLVDSDLVKSEKIAGNLYFWSFSSDNLQKLQRQISDVEAKAAKITQRLETIGEQVSNSQNAAENLAASEVLTREMEVLLKEKQTLENQIKQLQGEVDYSVIKSKDCDSKKLLEAANRWTDNIFMTKTWCKKKFDKQDRELNKAFGIPDELDYVDI